MPQTLYICILPLCTHKSSFISWSLSPIITGVGWCRAAPSWSWAGPCILGKGTSFWGCCWWLAGPLSLHQLYSHITCHHERQVMVVGSGMCSGSMAKWHFCLLDRPSSKVLFPPHVIKACTTLMRTPRNKWWVQRGGIYRRGSAPRTMVFSMWLKSS